MSIASINADPMMPNISVTSLATIVSTNASDGVIVVLPETTVRFSCSLILPFSLS